MGLSGRTLGLLVISALLATGLAALSYLLIPTASGRLSPPSSQSAHAAPQPAASRPPLPLPLDHPYLVVVKSQRRLFLYAGNQAVRTYRIGLGPHPIGPKQQEGDGRTPEGEYYICSKNPRSGFTLSLGLSYPNVQDAAKGLRAGLITAAQYRQIVRAHERRERPPWKTPLGGEIFIHGRGSGTDWTLGCLALDDRDVIELYHALPLGTPVTILPGPLKDNQP